VVQRADPGEVAEILGQYDARLVEQQLISLDYSVSVTGV